MKDTYPGQLIMTDLRAGLAGIIADAMTIPPCEDVRDETIPMYSDPIKVELPPDGPMTGSDIIKIVMDAVRRSPGNPTQEQGDK